VIFAVEHNPDARAALERIKAADADIKAARAAFYPQLNLSAEYSRTNNPMYSFGNILNQGMFSDTIDFNDPGTTDTLQTKASIQYRLYNGGHDRAALEAADARNRAVPRNGPLFVPGWNSRWYAPSVPLSRPSKACDRANPPWRPSPLRWPWPRHASKRAVC